MKYIAHIRDQEEQALKEHLENTAKLAGAFADKFHAYEWGFCCGMLHDMGKYSKEFQKRIRGDGRKVDHATAGAQWSNQKGGWYRLLSYCIAGHHAGLPDTGERTDTGDSKSLCGRLKKKIPDYGAYKEEVKFPDLTAVPFAPVEAENADFFTGTFIRMLYSCLVDADFLDTEQFMSDGKTQRESGESIDQLYKRLSVYVSEWSLNYETDTVNGRRSEILRNCLEKAKEERGLFRLTVPTGGGKTIASLAFALRHAMLHGMSRVIYVIPYTSIIEQNAEVFRKILGVENVLENHCNVDYESDEELKPMQLASENWDKPVIVTTNVQFFESLFSNKSSKCRKLHNIADSVIIFDEAQMLPNDYLKPCIAIMEQLLRHYKVSIVLCTATQPALDSFFSPEIEARELCPRLEEQFKFFRRVTFRDLKRISEETLIERLSKEEQALCILNTKKQVQHIYRRLQGKGTYHLSTSMYPAHRKMMIEKIKQCLLNGEKCIVISTSLVEAGVDMDFRSVYRQAAGIDSMIQAAGRCNREGKRTAEESHAYIFRLEEREYVPGQRQQIAVTEDLLEDGLDLMELQTVQQYFEMLYHFRGESLDKKNILGQFQKGRFSFRKVSQEFRLIETDAKTVLIQVEERAKEILKELRLKGFSKRLMREVGQYCVQLYEEDFDKMNGLGILQKVSEDILDFYVLLDEKRYTEDMGLVMDVKYGEAVIF